MTEIAALPRVTLFGVPIVNATAAEAIALWDGWLRARDGRPRATYIANAHTLNLACETPAYRAVLARADAVFGDGSGVRLAARLHGVRMRANLVGTDLLPAFFAAPRAERWSVYLLGGTAETAARAAARVAADFPGVRVVGWRDGWRDRDDPGAAVDAVNAAAPDVLLVAMGNPLQERWIDAQRTALRVPLSVGVGGLFDHWAGSLRRAPAWVRRLGSEWVQILLQQPHKWRRYLLGNPKFVYRALRDARGW